MEPPPGQWLSPGGEKFSEPIGTNDAKDPPRLTVPVQAPVWKAWSEVPTDIHEVAKWGPWCVEVFSGTARLTKALQARGLPCLPPIDITRCEMVPQPFDVVDVDRWNFFMQLIYAGAIGYAHFGTPCNSYSAARKDDGGPPPLRSLDWPDGLPSLTGEMWCTTFLGNLFKDRTCEACLVLSMLGFDFSIENPLGSLIWETPAFRFLVKTTRSFTVDFDQCAFGAPSMKPTRVLGSHQLLTAALLRKCPGKSSSHRHVVLKGKVFSQQFGRVVYRTKLAQVYPHLMCQAMADAVQQLVNYPMQHLEASFSLVNPKGDRKRPLGQRLDWEVHRQQNTALAAVSSGYQLKRGALKPLLDVECEPGEAVRWSMQVPHPFSVSESLCDHVRLAMDQVAHHPHQVITSRKALLRHWQHVAQECLHRTDQQLRKISDAYLRHLLRGVPDDRDAQLGLTCNVELYRVMLQAVDSVDTTLPEALLNGFPIVGPIDRSFRWGPYEKPQSTVSLDTLRQRAWEIRKKIINRVKGIPTSDNLLKIWEATIEDVEDGSCLGPFDSEQEVSGVLGCDDWIPTQRFEVVQKNKVRGCDSATTNMINQATVITEKLQLPSTDTNVAAIRYLRSAAPMQPLGGWVLDEKKAYRQVPINPGHRKYSVITMKNPKSGNPSFFVMVGHSFGLVSAVYNYNRRSAAINEILVKLFKLVAFSFYDDKYGFEPMMTVQSAHEVAQAVHWWLGARYDAKKLQLARDPTILGVTYNLEALVLEIKESRKRDLLEEIDGYLTSGLLDPGSAGKLKGKLMFGASQLWGKVGRAFLRPISERQYARFPVKEGFLLNPALSRSLAHWRKLIESGPPRPIEFKAKKISDAVIFTDGFTPGPRFNDQRPSRIGAVLFDRKAASPVQFSEVVPLSVQQKWLPRKTQIVPVEMLAPILALETFRDRLYGADVILLIDSEAVEAALVKGYSSKEDLCDLISVFWDLAFQLRVRVFIDRIATDANPADWPSRGDLSIGEAAGWRSVKAVWPTALRLDRSIE